LPDPDRLYGHIVGRKGDGHNWVSAGFGGKKRRKAALAVTREGRGTIPDLPLRKDAEKRTSGGLERGTGIEPVSQAWEAWARPLYQPRPRISYRKRGYAVSKVAPGRKLLGQENRSPRKHTSVTRVRNSARKHIPGRLSRHERPAGRGDGVVAPDSAARAFRAGYEPMASGTPRQCPEGKRTSGISVHTVALPLLQSQQPPAAYKIF
jgi:hypothetical protein